MKTIWIRQGDEEFADWLALRDRVLREPLGLCFSTADLEEEIGDRHLLGFSENRLVGGLAVRIQGDFGNIWKIRQVAVDPSFQGRGIGKKLMEVAEAAACGEEVGELTLHSRAAVVRFYERLGFAVEGEPFVEVGLPHRRMRKILS